MLWLIIVAAILGIILAAHSYAMGSERSSSESRASFHITTPLEDRPYSQPVIFLKAEPSEEPWDSSALKKWLLVSEEKPTLPRAGSKIEQITRTRLPGSSVEPTGYGLYSYLLFGSSSEAGRSRRYATSRAYCKNFPELGQALELGTQPVNLNVFLVPTTNLAPSDGYCRDAKALVDDYYDYAMAQKLLHGVGLEGAGIFLVACSRPIISDGCDPEKMLVMDLTTVKENLAELGVLEFRRLARKPETWNDLSLRRLAYELRITLPDIKDFITIAKAVAKER